MATAVKRQHKAKSPINPHARKRNDVAPRAKEFRTLSSSKKPIRLVETQSEQVGSRWVKLFRASEISEEKREVLSIKVGQTYNLDGAKQAKKLEVLGVNGFKVKGRNKTQTVVKKNIAKSKLDKSKISVDKDALLINEIKKAGKEASKQSIKVLGYTVIAKDGYVVKKFADGTIKKIKKI